MKPFQQSFHMHDSILFLDILHNDIWGFSWILILDTHGGERVNLFNNFFSWWLLFQLTNYIQELQEKKLQAQTWNFITTVNFNWRIESITILCRILGCFIYFYLFVFTLSCFNSCMGPSVNSQNTALNTASHRGTLAMHDGCAAVCSHYLVQIRGKHFRQCSLNKLKVPHKNWSSVE